MPCSSKNSVLVLGGDPREIESASYREGALSYTLLFSVSNVFLRLMLANCYKLSDLQIVWGPALVLGLAISAYIARMTRSGLLEIIRED